MFEETVEKMRNTDEFKENFEILVQERFFNELPNDYTRLIAVLSNDEEGQSLLNEVKRHMQESTRGKISLEKREDIKNKLFMHMYEEKEELAQHTISPTKEDSDYTVEHDSFSQLESIATNFGEKKAQIEQEIKTSNIY